jgi:hypothetical protein
MNRCATPGLANTTRQDRTKTVTQILNAVERIKKIEASVLPLSLQWFFCVLCVLLLISELGH